MKKMVSAVGLALTLPKAEQVYMQAPCNKGLKIFFFLRILTNICRYNDFIFCFNIPFSYFLPPFTPAHHTVLLEKYDHSRIRVSDNFAPDP